MRWKLSFHRGGTRLPFEDQPGRLLLGKARHPIGGVVPRGFSLLKANPKGFAFLPLEPFYIICRPRISHRSNAASYGT